MLQGRAGRNAVTVSLAASLLCATQTQAQEREKSAAVIEIGAAAESQMVHGEFSSGPYVALEFEAVRDWLEIEIGVSPQFSGHQTDCGIPSAPSFNWNWSIGL
jgi:hypothetical protein